MKLREGALTALMATPHLVSWLEMADHPYGAPRHMWVVTAGTSIVHLQRMLITVRITV